jgi:hypothetical protein
MNKNSDENALDKKDLDENKPKGVGSNETAPEATEAGTTPETTAAAAQANTGAREIVPFLADARPDANAANANARPRAPRRSKRLTLLAASVVAAAAAGAMAGGLAATGVARLASDPAPQAAADPTVALQGALTQLRAEVASLKANLDATSRSSTTQYNKLVERFDRAERAQQAAAKSDAAKSEAALPKEAPTSAAARDATGSITPANPAATLPVAPLPPAVTPIAVVPGWAVRDVYRGVAMLQSRVGGMIEVEQGDVLPGLGRIEAIRRQDGHWVVVTTHGMIVSMR